MTATVAPNATRLARRLLGVRLPPASIASELRESRGSLQAISGEVPTRIRAGPLVVVVVSAPHPRGRPVVPACTETGPDFAGRRRERGRGRRPEHGRRLLAELVRDHLVSEHAKALFAYAGKLPHAERLHSTEGSVRGRLLTVTRNLVVDRMRSASARHETVGADDRDRTSWPSEPRPRWSLPSTGPPTRCSLPNPAEVAEVILRAAVLHD